MTTLVDTSFETMQGNGTRIPTLFDDVSGMSATKRFAHYGEYSVIATNMNNGGYLRTDDYSGTFDLGNRFSFCIYDSDLAEGQTEKIYAIGITATYAVLILSIINIGGALYLRIDNRYYYFGGLLPTLRTVNSTVILQEKTWYCVSVSVGTEDYDTLSIKLDGTTIYSQQLRFITPDSRSISNVTFYDGYDSKLCNVAFDDIKMNDVQGHIDCLTNVYTGGPYITLSDSNIASGAGCLKPINVPYQRLNEGLEEIRNLIYETGYTLWEWWINTFWSTKRA